MLQAFSWVQFLIAASLLCFLWYVFVLLVFYRTELQAFLGGGSKSRAGSSASAGMQTPVGPREGAADRQGVEVEDRSTLMGASRLAEGVELRSSGQVGFAGLGGDGDGRHEQVGLVADVLQELKLLFLELERKAGDKREFFRLLEVVKENYGPLSGHPSAAALTGFVTGHAPFHLSPEEIENLWY